MNHHPNIPELAGARKTEGCGKTRQRELNPELKTDAGSRRSERAEFYLGTVSKVVGCAACYYLATRVAWILCFPDTKVSLFFPPHAVLSSILLLVPTRHWWAYTLAAAGSHFFATQQDHWPLLYALHCEVFDAVQNVSVAAGIRYFIKSPFHLLTLRDALIFVLIAVIVVPFGTAFWGAFFTVSNGFGTRYWVEWRNLGISNAVTAIVLIPALLLGAHRLSIKNTPVQAARVLECFFLAAGVLTVGIFAFNRAPAGPQTSPALLYAPIPLLIWAALRFGLGGVSASLVLITIQAIWGTMRGHGPFLTQTPSENALALQTFLLMVATPLVLLAVSIADEKRSKEALRISEERMSLAAQSAHLALWEWDMSRDEIWMTNEGRKFFGGRPDERLDYATLGGRVHPDDRAARAAAIERVLGTGGNYDIEYRVILANGSVRWIAARGHSPPTVNGQPVRVRGVSIDITRQKLADAEAQRQRAELAHLSRVADLGMLTGSITHELGQPLQAILANAEAAEFLLQDDLANLNELRAIVQDIRNDEERASSVISRLNALFKRGESKPCLTALPELASGVLALIRADADKRQIAIELDLPPGLPLVHVDRVHVQQVLLNLFINAMAALESKTEGQRTLTLRARRFDPDFVEVSVSDNGPGIEPEQLDHLFEPFFTTKANGMGLGLSISRTLIEAFGGRISVENNPAGGATFRFTLKRRNEQGDMAAYRLG